MTLQRSPKDKRRSRSELRELMIEVALEMFAATDAHVDMLTLNYQSVFDYLQKTRDIRVTHASVHERIWANQRAFQLDVMRTAAAGLPAETFLQRGAAMAVVVNADVDTAEGRRWATREMIRVSCNADMASGEPTLSVYRSIRLAMAGVSEDNPDYELVKAAIDETRDEIGARYLELFRGLVAALRLRARAALGRELDDVLLSLFTQVVALADGFGIDGANVNNLELPTGSDGEPQHWHLYSWSIWCAARTVLELDGDMPDDERAL